MRAWLPDARGHRRLFSALSIDALGTGLFLPFSILYFTATTDLTLGRVGLALSIAALVRIPATPGAGMFCDRFGARNTVVVSNLTQAVGFFNYLLVDSFGHLDTSGDTHAVSVNATPERHAPSAHASTSGWASALRDRPFLGFVVLNFGLALLSLAFGLGVPVFLVDTVHLPPWMPGTVLAVNAVLGAAGATPVGAAITGRSRSGSLMASQAIVGCAFLAVLCCAYVPSAFGVGLALAAVVLVTLGELIQSLIMSPIVNDCATAASRGRCNSLSQMAFSIGDVVTPALTTTLLAHGPAAAWIPLAALATVNMLGIALLTNHLPAMRRRVNHPAPTEADSRG
ncbi:MFS transporter [Streptomyces sp. OE57]|uniref:MFS transporter n=1 Tax=Streptomyces lacaronensis TaxID=3379885 RepID=UPI0039B78DF9